MKEQGGCSIPANHPDIWTLSHVLFFCQASAELCFITLRGSHRSLWKVWRRATSSLFPLLSAEANRWDGKFRPMEKKKFLQIFLLSHLQKQKQTGEMRSVILWKRLYKIFCWVTWINSFNTATQRYKLIKQIPLEHICLETDSPALGLHQHVSLKGFKIIIILRHSATSADMFNLSFVYQVRNEPANIILPCRYIADVKGLPPETVRLVTAHNAYRLFPKAKTRWQWRERDFEIQGSPSVWRHGKHNSLYYCPPLSVSLRGSTWTFLNAWWITLLTFEYQKGFSLLLRFFFFFLSFTQARSFLQSLADNSNN